MALSPHPSSVDRPASYRDLIVRCPACLVRLKSPRKSSRLVEHRWPGDADAYWKTCALCAHHPSHAMSATQRTWLAFCVTAVLVTNSICWARFERASLGTYSLAALSW